MISRRIALDKLAFYQGIQAVVCAVLNDTDQLKKIMRELWKTLFPELASEEEKKIKDMEDLIKAMPPVLYVTPRKAEVKEITEEITEDQKNAVRLIPGIKFSKGKAK